MKFGKNSLLALLASVLLSSGVASAQQTAAAREQDRSLNPTVTGGTGLFTVYDASTLKRGEFNIAAYYNNFDRDPGNVDISQQIVSGAVGLTDRLEFFAASVFRQQLTSEQPQELSGFLLPNVRFPGVLAGPVPAGPGSSAGAPFVNLIGPSVTNTSTAGALVGGVLPGLPQSGTVIRTTSTLPGDQRRLIGNLPGYLNDFPFYGNSEYTSGNTTLGVKYRFTGPERRFGVALIGFVEIPTSFDNGVFRNRGNGTVRGSGAGAVDYGAILAVTPRFGRFSISTNVGVVKTGDPDAGGIKYLDRRNKFIASVGLDVPVNQYFQIISELTSNVYFGSGTPNLNPVNPIDLTVGARFTPFGNKHKTHFSFGGAWRRFINQSNERRNGGDVNGFVINAVIGYRRKEVVAVDPCKLNTAPTVTLSSDKTDVTEGNGDSIRLTATASDSDANDTTLNYNWTASLGTISGSGPNVTYTPPAGKTGPATITVTVADTCCATATASLGVNIKEGNICPTVSVSASPAQIKEGSETGVALTAVGQDANNDQLTYTWSTSAGSIEGSGPNVTLNTKGLSAGRVVVNVTVNDGKCTGEASTSVEILSPPPPPQAYSLACDGTFPNQPFKRNIARTDNQCKAQLDTQVIPRLQSDPTAVVIIDGHSEKGERKGTAQKRAEGVKAYLISKGIDDRRIEIRTFNDQRAAQAPGGNNRRVTITVVPEGAQRPE
jgi:outer membrane protein OmpA-like peptidoglycan-associated protein